ncbi:MAG: hypothetical protein JSW65_03605 [Candidatus Bipolaricaulota bacterium]|nr:MAG: hypothetical protein JSW65_03605 [Candidatus Bipolaricaulota bacterium]
MKTVLRRSMLVLVLALPLIGGSAAVSGNTWELSGLASATIAFGETSLIGLDSLVFSAFLTYCDWAFQADAGLQQGAFDMVKLKGSGILGDLSLNSTLSLDPSTASFVSWKSGIAWSLDEDVSIVDTLYLADPQSASYNQISLTGTAQELSFQGTVKVSLCPLCFLEANVCVGWPLFGCDDGRVDLCSLFTDSGGFAMTTIGITGYTLFEDVLGVTGTFDAVFEFTPLAKSLTPILKLVPDWAICPEFEIIGEVVAGGVPIHVGAVRFKGIKGEFVIGGGATFSIAESLTDSANAELTGNADYFERIGVTAPLPSCCGAPGSIAIDAYFQRPPATTLFGWALLEASAEFRLSEGIGFGIELFHSASSPTWGIAVTTQILWDGASSPHGS